MASLKRKVIQVISTLITNANLKGFVEGRIYTGKLKNACVPGLNCYSCPGAIGSCPIGSMQTVLADAKHSFSYYVTGLLLLFGVTMGRFVCGYLCPFGLIQELLYKVPGKKITLPNWTKYIKYLLLVVFVIMLPLLWVNPLGMGDPTYCKYICPAGTLEAGVPLTLANPALRSGLGALFTWKVALLVVTIVLSILSFRPFCKTACPLGAIYALFNPISVYHYRVSSDKCIHCGKCSEACEMGIEPHKNPNHPECIRCGECRSVCPTGAIEIKFGLK